MRAPRVALKDLPPAMQDEARALRRAEVEEERRRFRKFCRDNGLPRPTAEHRFSERLWRFDWAWIGAKVAFEIDGGIWTSGRHMRGSGRLADMEKFNAAATLGWRVIYRTPGQVYTDETARLLRAAIGTLERAATGAAAREEE